jgi:hypothetical protein
MSSSIMELKGTTHSENGMRRYDQLANSNLLHNKIFYRTLATVDPLFKINRYKTGGRITEYHKHHDVRLQVLMAVKI